MRRLTIALVAAILVAGCTALPQDDGGDEQQSQRGLVVEQASLESTTVERGRSTRLILRVANTNPIPVDDFSADLSNLGGIQATPVEPGGGCSGTLSAATTSPGTLTCVWRLDTSGLAADDAGSYPIGITMEYTGAVTMQTGTLKFTFVQGLPERTTTTRSYSNGEVAMDVTHRTRYATDTDAVTLDLTLRSEGSGRIRPENDVRRANLSYSGSLMGPFGFTDGDGTDTEPRCTAANFLTGETSTTITCNLFRSDSIAAGTTYSLRVNGTYPYQRYREVPLRVVD